MSEPRTLPRVAAPAHGVSGPTTVQRVRTWAFRVLAVDFVILAVLGIWLAFKYEPGGGGLSTVHSAFGIVAVVTALIAAAATVADGERSTAGVLPAIVVLGVIAGLYLTGPSLRWDQLGASGPISSQRGVTAVFDKDVAVVANGNRQMTAQKYRQFAWLHVVALPVAVGAMGGAGAWAIRRRRTYVPRRAVETTPAE